LYIPVSNPLPFKNAVIASASSRSVPNTSIFHIKDDNANNAATKNSAPAASSFRLPYRRIKNGNPPRPVILTLHFVFLAGIFSSQKSRTDSLIRVTSFSPLSIPAKTTPL
jgi:hypothetical protein